MSDTGRIVLVNLLVIMSLLSNHLATAKAQDGQGIEAPDFYFLDVIGLPTTEPSQFKVYYEFIGTHQETSTDATLLLEGMVNIQPEPAAIDAKITASGNLSLHRLVPYNVTDQHFLASHQVYTRSAYFTQVELGDSGQSCGKSTIGPGAASAKLDEQLPFPNEIFFGNTIPDVPRVFPDGEFGGNPTARYELEIDTRLVSGTLHAEFSPQNHQLIRFSFDGHGIFQLEGDTLEGTLTYHYERLVVTNELEIERPQQCQKPHVRGIPIFEPSITWVIRDMAGEYTTNRTISALLDFYNTSLNSQDYELVSMLPENLGRALATYRSPDGTIIEINFLDGGDFGTDVSIRVLSGMH